MVLGRIAAATAFAALVASAFGISCYTTSGNGQTGPSGEAVFPQIETVGSNFTSCVSYNVEGSASSATDSLIGLGRDGDGATCTCAELASAAGCNNGTTSATWLAGVRQDWLLVFSKYGNNAEVTADAWACCETDLCNNGLGVNLTGAATLPTANMLTLLATVVVGFVVSAKLL